MPHDLRDQVSKSKSRSWSGEIGGALGDLGTFIPHTLGAISIAGLAPAGVFLSFGLFYIATSLFYRLPIPVQPMKAVSAVLLTGGLTPREIAATGVLIGLLLILLGVTGLIARLACAIPRSVTSGLQLGLGASLGWLSLQMIGQNIWIGAGIVALLIALLRVPRVPATLVALAFAIAIGHSAGTENPWPAFHTEIQFPALIFPGFTELEQAMRITVLPQLALTLTNAIIVTAAISGELFGPRLRVTPTNLALSSGIANLILAPIGAFPMCHGAGGLAAHYRFGARTGIAPLLLGIALLTLGLLFAQGATRLLAAVPTAAVGALLFFSAIELAWSKRLLDARAPCRVVIGITAAATLLTDPLWGLLSGWCTEMIAGRFDQSRNHLSLRR